MKRDFMTEKKIKIFLFAKKAALALFAATAFAACDAGLGESVDTSAPTVAVTSPASSAVLGGAFNVEGTCFDDKAVARVVVTVANTGTGAEIGTYNAAISGNNWTLTLNEPANGAYPMLDGTYSASAICYDAVGRQSGVASRVFEVDNTAPVFCVTSPNSLNISDPAAYGRSVKIKGEIADDHAISSMDIRVFKYSNGSVSEITSSMAKTSFSGFETAGGTEVKIAQYYPDDQIPAADSDEYPLYQNYMAMYSGAAVGDTVNFYIFPFLTDVAGNTSVNCYIQTQLKKLVSDACNVETTSDSLQTAQFKKMLNGSYSLNELDVSVVKQILDGSFVQTSTSYNYWAHMSKTDDGVGSTNALLAMSVNANNAPMYEFGGYAVDTSALSFTEASPGGQISVRISAGLDGTLLVPSSLKVYLWECDDTLTLADGQDIRDSSTASYSSERGDVKVMDGETPVADLTEAVATGTYTVTLPGGLVGGSRYRLTAYGVDQDNNELYSDSVYAFMTTISANAPSVDFDGQFFVAASAVKNSTSSEDCLKAVFSIEDKSDSPVGSSGTYAQVIPVLYKGYYAAKTTLPAAADWTGEPLRVEDSGIVKVSDGNYSASFDMNVFDLDSYSESNYTIALKVLAKNGEATSETSTYIFWVDNQKPALAITTPVNNAKVFESDSNYDSETQKYTPRGTWSDIEGSGTYRLWSSTTQSVAPTFTYSQASGNSDGETVYYEKKAANAYIPLGKLESGQDVSEYYTLSVSAGWNEVEGVSQTASQTNWSAPISVEQSVGQRLSFIAMDAAGNVSDLATRTGIAFDFALPTLELTSEPGASSPVDVQQYYTSDNALSFDITALDSFRLNSLDISATLVRADGTTVTLTSDNATYGFSIVATSSSATQIVKTVKIAADSANGKGDGSWTIKAVATDSAGRKTEQTLVSTMVDCVKPQFVAYSSGNLIAIGKNADGLQTAWYKDQTLTVWGKVNEQTSGLYMVYYWLNYPERGGEVPSDLTAQNDGMVTIGGTKGSAVQYKIMPDSFVESKSSGGVLTNNFLFVQAVDLAGNKSDKISYEIREDQTPPTVSTAYYTYDDGATMSSASGSVMTNGQKPLTLYGAVNDSLSGLSAISFKIGESAVAQGASGASILYLTNEYSNSDEYKAASDWTALSGLDASAVKSWKAVVAKSAITSGDLFVTATDAAGNSSEQKAFALVLDTEPPTITLSSPATILKSASGTASAINGSVTFKGTASDNNGLASVALYYSPTAADSTWTELASVNDASMYNWSAQKDVSAQSGSSFTMLGYDDLYDGSAKPLYLKVVATDAASNSVEKIYKYSIDPDGDRPKVTITNVALEGMLSAKPAWRTGTSDIYGSVSDDDDITKFEYSTDGGSNWTDLTSTMSGTSFTITGLPDGEHTLQFRVTDGAGTVFTSSSAQSYLSPKLYGKSDGADSGKFENGDTQLYVNIDTQSPITNSPTFNRYSAASASYDEAAASLGTVGGDRSKFKYNVYANDTNGIASVSVKIKDTQVSVTQQTRTKTETINGVEYEWFEVKDIDISALASGTYTAEIVVTDKAGLEKKDTIQIAVDNDAPEVNITYPSDKNLTILGKSSTAYGSASEYAGGVYYAVCPIAKSDSVKTLPQSFSSYYNYDQKKTVALASSVTLGAKNYVYTKIEDASVSWNVSFDSDLNSGSGTHAYSLNDFMVSYGITTAAAIADCSFSDLVQLYIWIKAVDDVGNITEECRAVIVDPQGDRPTIGFNYPEENGTTVGGTVKITGDVEDNYNEDPKTADTAWIQIISDKVTGHGTYSYDAESKSAPTGFAVSAADVKAWVGYKKDGSSIYSVYKIKDYVIAGSNTRLDESAAESVTDAEASQYAILANFGGTNWDLSINSASEFNNDDDVNQIAVRAYAYNGKLSVPAYSVMTFDADAPEMSDRYLRQYDGSAVSASRVYRDGIYISDKNESGNAAVWYVTFTLKDSDKVKKIGFSNTSAEAAKGAADLTSTSEYCSAENGDYSVVKIKYPLSQSITVGKETLYVYYEDAKDQNPGKGHYTFTVNHDNVDPAIAAEGSADFNISPTVCNSNGWYTLGSKASEPATSGASQSGFARVVVYFKRAASNKIFDPMYSKGYDMYDSGGGNYTIATDSGVVQKEGLYWKQKTVTVSGSAVTLSEADASVHKGGLVKISGVNYRISSVSGTSVAIESETEYDSQSVTAYFALGNVIDNTIKESEGSGFARNTLSGYGYGYGRGTPAHDNDDGDLMIESVLATGSDYVWEACVNSKNIPDGPIDICYTVYDAAGNYATGSVTNSANSAFVSNNAPRLANVTIGTDYNGNDEIEAAESYTWFAQSKASWEEALAAITVQGETDGSAYITAKGKTTITPEILGGNGALYYSYSYPTSAQDYASGYNTTAFMASDTGSDSSREDQKASNSQAITMQVGDLMQAYKGTGEYTFVIYDSTEETVGVPAATNSNPPSSQHADITLYMDNQVNDTTAPIGKIQRFYWNGINDNSIYGSSSAQDPRDLLGHIELEGELPSKDFTDTSGEMDKDPKVSGKIVIRGSAYDALRLDSLYVTLPGFTGLSGLVDSGLTGTDSAKFYTVATFDAASQKWSDSDDATITLASNGWRFNVDSNVFSANGHYVTWSLELDTSKYNSTAPAAVDKKIEFMAKDMGAPTCGSGTEYTSVDGTTKYAASAFNSKKQSSYTDDSEVSSAVYATDSQAAAGAYYASAAAAKADTSSTYASAAYYKRDFASIGAGEASGMSSVKVYQVTFAGSPYYRVDIVPYITKIYTNLAKSNTSNWSVFNRTAAGNYPVYTYVNSTTSTTTMETGESETAQVYGFNLNGLKYNGSDLTAVAAGDRQDTSDAYDCYSFDAAKVLSGSGAQEVEFTVNDCATLNNKNANGGKGAYSGTPNDSPTSAGDLEEEYSVYANYYNRLPNDSNNNRLTDDVRFEVWQINNSAAVPISNKIVEPVMKINPSNGMIGFAFENDPTYFSMPTSTRSYDYWAGTYDKITVPNFDYTSSGEAVAVGEGNDISGSTSDLFVLFYSKWNYDHAVTSTCNGSNCLRLEPIGHNTGGNYWDKLRIQSPSVVTAGSHVYLAYYDHINSEIRFKSSLKNGIPESIGTFGNFSDDYTNTLAGLQWKNSQQFANSSKNNPGNYLCLAAAAGKGESSDDLVAIVWYDGSDCYYSCNTTPGTDRNQDTAAEGWDDTKKVFSGAGKYCKIAFDHNVGVHIAAYDAENGCVRYAYSASATSPSFTTCVVNANDSGGSYLTLDVALEGSAPVPQIGYYSSGCAKPVRAKYVGATALSSSATSNQIAGAFGNYMTGSWEISAVPTTSTVSKDRVNVALRKGSDGKITAPATGTSYYKNTASGYSSDSYGYVYGLGNTNAVMGYCRAVGAKTYIETAQIK